MSLLSEGSVANDRCLLRQTFGTRRMVQDMGGVLVGCTVGRYGLRPTAASSRITYNGTQSLAINTTKLTIRARIRTGAANNGATTHLIDKAVSSYADNQFLFLMFANWRPMVLVANALADTGQYITANASLSLSTNYVLHFVYDGSLAAGSRALLYANGILLASTITGTIPASMRASTAALTVFNMQGGSTLAPATDSALLDFALWQRAFSAAETLDDAQDRTYLLGGP